MQHSEQTPIRFTVFRTSSKEEPISVEKIKPELYKEEEGKNKASKPNGELYVSLSYEPPLEKLVLRVVKALNLPAKDFSGTSDPYVKVYLLPDRKTKYQTKVHRKECNPVFEETFEFNNVPMYQLPMRTVVLVVCDFDRFSRHDLIGSANIDLADTDLSSTRMFCLELTHTHPSQHVQV